MPHNFDFSLLSNIKTMEVFPEGWISPLEIEYAVGVNENVFNGIPSYLWRVKGTSHTFTIPVSRIDFVSQGDYQKHFSNALEIFRENYITWKEGGFSTPWARDYREQYYKFIIT